MGAIAGFVAPQGESPSRTRLEHMADALAERGPDAHGIEVTENVGLVHTRLGVIDPSPSPQPIGEPSGHWLLTCDGEVFNHGELRGQLPDREYRDESDTETLLHSLLEWGERAVDRLRGQFAFAAMDRKARRLHLVRDQFGVKPLYVARHGGSVLFASEIAALLAAGMPRRARPELLAHWIAYRFPSGLATSIEGIEKVQPGSIVTIDLETLESRERRWYDPADSVDPQLAEELNRRDRTELVDLLEESLRRAVRRRLPAGRPLGTMCSGGLDSSLVTALARDERPDLVAFTISQPEDPADETRWTARVAEALGIEWVSQQMTAADWRADLVPAVRAHEHPHGPVVVPLTRLARSASASGINVLLAGEGADGLFGGMSRLHRDLYRDALPIRLRLQRTTDGLRGRGLKWLPRSAARRLGRELRRARHLRGRPPPLPSAESSDRYDRDLARAALTAYAHHAGPVGRLEAALLQGPSRGSTPWMLIRTDKNAIRGSVDVRVPILDPELVGLIVNLPIESRIGPQPKGILRDVASRHLPASVARRPKRPGMLPDVKRLMAPARPGFVEDGHLRELLGLASKDWRETLRDLTSEQAIRAYTSEIWCRLFLDDQDNSTVEAELWRPCAE